MPETELSIPERVTALRLAIQNAYHRRWLRVFVDQIQRTDDLKQIYADFNDLMFDLGLQNRARLSADATTYVLSKPPYMDERHKQIVRNLIEIARAYQENEGRNYKTEIEAALYLIGESDA